jgi:hypothetical protein
VRRAEGAIFEARKPYLKQQMELCINASESAAVLASTHDYAMWEKARERFWVLYWRPLSIVEMPFGDDIGPVEQLMVAIGNKLGPVKAIRNSRWERWNCFRFNSHIIAAI